MRSKDILILNKILNYITEVQSFIKGYSQEVFYSDRKTINACVFDLSQIGELTGKISEETINENKQIEWKGLKALRNRIVHDYEGVNLSMVWEFVSSELDVLEEQIKDVINKLQV